MKDLTEDFILNTGYFGRTEKDGVPSLFNGDNIMLAIREYNTTNISSTNRLSSRNNRLKI